MAVVKFGTIVTDIKGKVGGQVFQGGNFCKVLRNNTYNTGQRSTARQQSTGNLSYISGFWKSLSNTERAEWDAIRPVWTFTDAFGNEYEGSAFQVFCAYNKALLDMGQSFVGEPAPPPLSPGFDLTLVQVNDSGNIRITWTLNPGSNSIIGVFMTAARTPGLNSRNLKFRKITQFADSLPGIFNCLSCYQPIWGQPLPGSTIYYRLHVRNALYPRLVSIIEGSLISQPFI